MPAREMTPDQKRAFDDACQAAAEVIVHKAKLREMARTRNDAILKAMKTGVSENRLSKGTGLARGMIWKLKRGRVIEEES